MNKNTIKDQPCPCCGYLMFYEVGDYDICRICYWENDLSQLRFPRTTGANKVSLIEAQQNYLRFSVSEEKYRDRVSPPNSADVQDPEWRPISSGSDDIEEIIPGFNYSSTYPKDKTTLYYWRNTFWRK